MTGKLSEIIRRGLIASGKELYVRHVFLLKSGLSHLALDHSFLGNSLHGTANKPERRVHET
jgi:hypothetical protein